MRLLQKPFEKEKWSFRSLEEVRQAANNLLHFSMFNERSKRWPKVAESYRRLLWMLDKNHFPKDYEPPATYSILMYEIHYHLGVALQRLNQHRKAIVQYGQAIKSVSIPKGGCLAGCVGNSCLMTPILARRAFAYAKVGDLKGALRDAENSVVLDSRNPDVYCIRALVRGSRDEETMALTDVDQALKLKPDHVCALIIRGALSRTLAEKLNSDSQSFNTITDFNHPSMLDFYDRFLFTLSVPHTITDINLTPDKPSRKQLDLNPELYGRSLSRISSAPHSQAYLPGAPHISEVTEPFRCGTSSSRLDSKTAVRRRKDYGEAVRKFMARPKTASEFLAQLDKERTRRMIQEQSRLKPSSPSMISTTQQSQAPITPAASSYSRKSSITWAGRTSETVSDQPSERALFSAEGLTPKSSLRLDTENGLKSGRTTRTSCIKTFTFDSPTNYSIPVFQPLNIKDAPRMYYRPWLGDKLPVADVVRPPPSPAFY